MSLIPDPKPSMVVCTQKGSLALTLVIAGDNKFVMSGFLGGYGALRYEEDRRTQGRRQDVVVIRRHIGRHGRDKRSN